MNIILGATGQVGSYLINELKSWGLPVRAVVRDPDKLSDRTIDIRRADLFNVEQLTEAFKGGTTVFVLTPEDPTSNDIIEETGQIVENYKKAILATGIKKVVALSCIGAHIKASTGNILMSRILEQALDDLPIDKVFIRPSYYFNNWLGYLETVKDSSVLPSFFAEDLKIDMLSPVDVAKFIAKIIIDPPFLVKQKIYELVGPQQYSSGDVANEFSKLLNKKVSVGSIPHDQWKETLLSTGFTENTAENLSDMTQAVIDHLVVPEFPQRVIAMPTTLECFFRQQKSVGLFVYWLY